MGFWSSIGSAVSSIANAIFLDYRKYGSVYRVLEIDSKKSDMNLGVGEELQKKLNELPDTNAEYLKQFLDEPLSAAFDYFETKKSLASQEVTLIEMQKVMQDSTSDHLKSLVDNLTDQQMKLNSKLQQNKYLEFLK
jgi:hypothetical protein